jgi:hypothetical protein
VPPGGNHVAFIDAEADRAGKGETQQDARYDQRQNTVARNRKIPGDPPPSSGRGAGRRRGSDRSAYRLSPDKVRSATPHRACCSLAHGSQRANRTATHYRVAVNNGGRSLQPPNRRLRQNKLGRPLAAAALFV